MPKTYSKQGTVQDFTTPFDVQTTRPLDIRLVVDSVDDLINGSIEAPYKGMVVNIAGTSELYILISEPEYADNPNNWELVTGSGGNGLSKYSIPVMTPEMVIAATEDSDVDFDGSEDTHILLDYESLSMTEEKEDLYFGMIQSMMGVIKELQSEVTRLKNHFKYGIDSYQEDKTTIDVEGSNIDVDEEEPLWAIDPIGLELVPDNPKFITVLDDNYKFEQIGQGTITSVTDESGVSRLTFNDCGGKFYDGISSTADETDLTLYKLSDSKLITYLVTDKPDIKIQLISLTDKSLPEVINLSQLIPDDKKEDVEKYGFCIVISRKEKETGRGFNYVYISIIDFNENVRICDGYLQGDTLVAKYPEDSEYSNDAYSIRSLEFDRLTLSRMKFYTKYEDFSLFRDKEEIIPSQPDYEKYEVAHIAIRAVKDTDQLNEVANRLVDNELIWNKDKGTLHIKSGGKIYKIGSNSSGPDDDEHNKDKYMTDKQLIETLEKMGIIVHDVTYKKDADGNDIIDTCGNISMNPIADMTFINQDTGKRFIFSVDTEGNLVSKYAGNDDPDEFNTIEEFLESLGTDGRDYDKTDFQAVRGFISDYLFRRSGTRDKTTNLTNSVNLTSDAFENSDRLRISSFYAPISTDETHGCTHSFIELENTSPFDIPLTGIYLHFLNPTENQYDNNDQIIDTDNNPAVVHHLALDGVIPAGGTYLIRGAKHAEFDDESAFIKVRTYDKEWYENGKLISFEQEPVKVSGANYDVDSPVKSAYRFCLTYGLPNLNASTTLVERNGDSKINGVEYKSADFPTKILNPRFIDSCSYSTLKSVSQQAGVKNPWYANGDSKGVGIIIKKNTMFRLTFALDPAKQAFNGFNAKDSSRVRYNKDQDLQILDLSKEFIGFPHSDEIIKIDRYTPKASFEHKNVMTDKSQLNREKPNMVTCSFGVDVYNTRCFNWISCGTFDESVWIRIKNDSTPNSWKKFDSYKKVSSAVSEGGTKPYRKEYSVDVNNTVYARMINRFPGNDVLFTAHKCVVVLPDVSEPTVYEYVVGRPDKDDNPDFNHTNEVYTFTVYPRTYEGRVYQITDQQGFHWIEYQVWAASAEYLNTKIDAECKVINDEADEIDEYNREAEEYNNSDPAPATPRELQTPKTRVFPILINTGDMTQSGARINEWLDYYNGGQCLFNHLEQMNVVGNNDLCPIDPRDLGTGNDEDKSSSHFFHYFYCFDVKDTDRYNNVSDENKKFFSGESLIVKAHTGSVKNGDKPDIQINITEDKYIPSFYYFKTTNILYVMVNSEIPITNCQLWFGLCSSNKQYVNIYTGIEAIKNGEYANADYFTPLYNTLYAWLYDNKIKDSELNFTGDTRRVIVAMHEMPFTVITRASLAWDQSDRIPSTRNHPTGAKARVGSNVNQLIKDENRGLCWCSRLLEYFGCKLVIGGHKHTYALSYPIKEKYKWGTNLIDSKDQIKPMGPDLSDEAGENPTCPVSWDIDLTDDTVRTEYNINIDRSKVGDDIKLNSTKTPYVPEALYNTYGKNSFNNSISNGRFRCCTPIPVNDGGKYDGFVTYSMCQATGYKLKSNKELPSDIQVFSKIIPLTDTTAASETTDKPNPNQLYPMYSILEFNDDCSELSVTMNRITGIFQTDGADVFTQNNFGDNRPMTTQTLCTYTGELNKEMYGKWYDENSSEVTTENEYLHIKF